MYRPLALALACVACAMPALAADWPAHPRTNAEITAVDLSVRDRRSRTTCFEGRAPGEPTGEAAATWIADELKRLGVKPANGASYFQDVPAVTIQLDSKASSFSLATPKGALTPKFADDVMYWSPHFDSADVKVTNSPLVFVGYGAVAPEYSWNDYAGIDVKGKTVVMLINDPGNEDAQPDDKFFKGRAMTYYGRWIYKFEEVARQGAAAAIIVHETKPAAYGWQVVRNSNGAAKMWLEAPDQNKSRAMIEGWVTLDTAKELFARAGLDYATLKAAANKPGFKPVPITGVTLTASAHSSITHMKTRNVLGVLPGAKRPGEVVMYSAHWDHLGRKDNLEGADKIYNGAIDNGLGIAETLELAEKFAHGKAPERSVAFAFWTLEEQGLLGSQYFAEHPLWPRKDIVGVINMDAPLPQGRTHDISASGTGQSELEDVLKETLAKEGRTLSPDPKPENGHFYRSDHFPLAKVGIPAISPKQGTDLLVGGVAAGQKVYDDYNANQYHQPSDEWSATWDLSGAEQDTRTYYAAGLSLANSAKWPNYYPQSEFRALRDRDRAP
ncbi:MAG: M28 family metallopeptidase [Alphaproteobacteria bacterium]